MYDTTDRKRGPKGNKVNQTRTVGRYGYGDKNFCTLNCQNDWWSMHGTRAVDYIGRLREHKTMTPENSWTKRERYSWQDEYAQGQYYYRNILTQEERPITEQQYNDERYNLNT
jgi:hypothetical protein